MKQLAKVIAIGLVFVAGMVAMIPITEDATLVLEEAHPLFSLGYAEYAGIVLACLALAIFMKVASAHLPAFSFKK